MDSWTNFQSGCGICRKSTDYYGLGGNKHIKSEMSSEDMFVKKNLGINYATAFGGKKKENSWIKHVKKVAKDKKISYKDALKVAKKTYKKKKVMKGGDSNMGQTGFPGKYFGNDVPMNSSSGFGVKTAYGISEPLDVGMGNLAPFNTAKKGPKLTGLQTGGRRKYKSKSKKRTKKKSVKKNKSMKKYKSKKN